MKYVGFHKNEWFLEAAKFGPYEPYVGVHEDLLCRTIALSENNFSLEQYP